jgi:Tfp pilus assembly protein PilF
LSSTSSRSPHSAVRAPQFAVRSLQSRLFPLALLLTAIAAFLVYLPALNYQFVWDDRQLVLDNPQLTSGSVIRVFTTTFIPADSTAGPAWGKYYRPLVNLSLLADYRLSGLNPRGYHFFNILLHVAATVLFALLAQMLFRSFWVTLLAGLVFALHPVHSESVAFVSARTDLLMTVFALGALLSALYYLRPPPTAYRLSPIAYRVLLPLAGVLFLLSLLAKETPVLMPFMFLVLALAEPSTRPRSWRLLAGLSLALAAYLAIRFAVLRNAAPVVNVMNPLQYLQMVLNIIGRYTAMLVYPFSQRVFLPQNPGIALRSCYTLLGVAAIVAPLLLISRGTDPGSFPRETRGLSLVRFPSLVGYLLFLASILPVTNVFSLGLAYAAERLAYLPSVGFVLMAAALAVWLSRRAGKLRNGVLVTAGLYLVLMPTNLLLRLPVWHDQVSLFRRMVQEVPGSTTARKNYGTALLDDRHEPDSAALQFRQALALHPDGADLHADLARALKELHDTSAAIAEYQQAIRLMPRDFETQNNLGQLWGRLGKLDSSVVHLELATSLHPDRAEPHSNLGIALALSGRKQEALEEFRRALLLSPGNRDVLGNLGALFYDLGERDSARYYLSRVQPVKP